MSDATKPPAEAAAQAQSNGIGKITVEVYADKNRNLLWGPTQARLRGAWAWVNMARGETSERGLMSMPDLPGQMITVDPRLKTLSIDDPLGEERNKGLLHKAQEVHEAIWGVKPGPAPAYKKEGATPNEIAEWLYWIIRCKQNGMVREVYGTVPEMSDLLKAYGKAKIRRRYYDSTLYRSNRNKDAMESVSRVAEDDT